MEHSFIKINTDNLVIDAFVISQLSLTEQEHIYYETDIHVNTELIPIDNYALYIILGNLLSNSMQECRKIQPPPPFLLNLKFSYKILNL